MPTINLKTALIFGLLVSVVLSGSVLAQTNPVQPTDDQAAGGRQAAKIRLEGAKLKACENREKAINNILDRIAKRGERRLNVYSAIANRVMEFYDNRGLTIANYDQLVADMESKKAAARAAVDQADAKDVDFQCDGTDPKGAAASFKTELKAQIQALHNYQQSVKNLIVAVKSAAGAAESSTNNEGAR